MDLLAVELAMDSWLWDSWLRNLGYESPGCGLLGPDGGASTARGGVGRPNLRDPENIETNPPEPLHRKLCLGNEVASSMPESR